MQEKPLILVVDDLADNIDILSSVLSTDYEIAAALNGQRALSLAKDRKPTLILLDIMMPDMDGFEVCRILKSWPETKDIPIIFITANNSVYDEVSALNKGGVDFISKPITAEIVRARVKTHLSLSNQANHLKDLVYEKTWELRKSREQILDTLARAAAYKDNETSDHVERMSLFAELLASKISDDKEWISLIRQSAKMHDIGKIGIADNILLKPGKLNAEEWEHMQKHVAFGGHIIEDDSTTILKMSKDVALYHHEKWDGTGYLEGLKGEEIPLAARVVAIADVFDALTSDRPYKQAWTMTDAMGYIQAQAGIHFDPKLASIFVTLEQEILAIKSQFKK